MSAQKINELYQIYAKKKLNFPISSCITSVFSVFLYKFDMRNFLMQKTRKILVKSSGL